MGSDFNWKELDAEDIITKEVRETAVYWNPDGDAVIRQRGALYDEDNFVVIPQDRILALITRRKTMVAEL